MQREIKFDRVDDLIAELNARDITKVAFSVVNENRARQVRDGVLQVEKTVRLEILAYRDATIFKCAPDQADIDHMHDIFAARGFEITRRSRNIT